MNYRHVTLPFCYLSLRILRLFLHKKRIIHHFYSYKEYKTLFKSQYVIKGFILGHFLEKVLPGVIFWCFCLCNAGASLDNVVLWCVILVSNKKPANSEELAGFVFLLWLRAGRNGNYWLNRNSISAFCACMRFSASSQTTASGASRISADTSLPR